LPFHIANVNLRKNVNGEKLVSILSDKNRNLANDFVKQRGEMLTTEELRWYADASQLTTSERTELHLGLSKLTGKPADVCLDLISAKFRTRAYRDVTFTVEVFSVLASSDNDEVKRIAFTRM